MDKQNRQHTLRASILSFVLIFGLTGCVATCGTRATAGEIAIVVIIYAMFIAIIGGMGYLLSFLPGVGAFFKWVTIIGIGLWLLWIISLFLFAWIG